jgi:hypothetical protein
MAHYANRGGGRFFETAKARKKRRTPLTERAKPAPASYGMSIADLDRLTAGRGDARRLMQRLASGRWAEDDE